MIQAQLTFLGPLSLSRHHCQCLMISLHIHLFEEDLAPAWYILINRHYVVPGAMFFSVKIFFLRMVFLM